MPVCCPSAAQRLLNPEGGNGCLAEWDAAVPDVDADDGIVLNGVGWFVGL